MSEEVWNPERPAAQDAARRLVILHHVILAPVVLMTRASRLGLENAAEGERAQIAAFLESQRDLFWSKLRERGLWEFLAPSELELAKENGATMSDQQIVNASWRAESANVLAWALGLRDEIGPYDRQTEPWRMNLDTDVAAFIASAKLRNPEEVEKARDLAELWHWRSRTRQLIEMNRPLMPTRGLKKQGFHSYDDIVRHTARRAFGMGDLPEPINEDFPVKAKAYRDLTTDEWAEVRSITMERHFGLNWLCGHAANNEWDETETST